MKKKEIHVYHSSFRSCHQEGKKKIEIGKERQKESKWINI